MDNRGRSWMMRGLRLFGFVMTLLVGVGVGVLVGRGEWAWGSALFALRVGVWLQAQGFLTRAAGTTDRRVWDDLVARALDRSAQDRVVQDRERGQ